MKKLFASLLLATGVCILFSSCGNMSLTKRHYSNGYYVDFGNKKTKAETKESEKTAQNVSVPATEPTINNELSAKTKTETAQINTDNKNDIQSAGKKLSDENPKVNTIKSFLKNKFQLKKALNKRSDSGGHSFLWKLCVLILILCLVSYLFGGFLGDIIYILFVIALILFILWLLGNL